ncbi:unnamed protein product [Microthlaspi erraticum]|uniref:DDE Tnp4 domain-containing protein n=1 Tax=Microthlaspi erraticum TaxID=1685480 RepID=A0A6D2INF7_9BRAS|nr:unnamed protein product [Microthlaspi erraticum]
MGSSSRDPFADAIDQNFNQMIDQYLDQSFAELLSSYEDQQKPKKTRKRRDFIERNCEQGQDELWNDYFSETPTYPPALFRRRFRMNKPLFLRIVTDLTARFEYFSQTDDATGRPGFTTLQKCAEAIRLLAYGYAADAIDEYLRMAAPTAHQALLEFVEGIIALYGEKYLRRPDAEDLQRLLQEGEQCGFPGMIGSIDCMHWEWKNFPTAWKGQYSRGSGKPTIVLEAVASYDLWIWHAFFGPPRTLNDLNVLDRSPVFDDIINGVAAQVHFSVNGHEYGLAYYLTDGIYPSWLTFIQSIKLPKGRKAKRFAKRQEGVRKDVERAFGVLQARFAMRHLNGQDVDDNDDAESGDEVYDEDEIADEDDI